MEQAAKASAAMMKQMMLEEGLFAKVFYQKYGKEALPTTAEVMSQGGAESGKMMQQMGVAKSMKGIGDAYKMVLPMMGLTMEVIELSDKELQFKTSECPYGIEGTSRELCEAMMAHDRKAMSTLLGQEVETKILKSVAVGDKECDVIFSKK